MRIFRIDHDKELNNEIDIIVICVNGEQFTLTERFGKLNILKREDTISVSPCCANQIDVS